MPAAVTDALAVACERLPYTLSAAPFAICMDPELLTVGVPNPTVLLMVIEPPLEIFMPPNVTAAGQAGLLVQADVKYTWSEAPGTEAPVLAPQALFAVADQLAVEAQVPPALPTQYRLAACAEVVPSQNTRAISAAKNLFITGNPDSCTVFL